MTAPHNPPAFPAKTAAFRSQLKKLMPGYDWTIHKALEGTRILTATGTQSSGFNRLSTLEVVCRIEAHGEWFTVRSAGYGRRAPWLAQVSDATLARALRGLQDHYRREAARYQGHEEALAKGRVADARLSARQGDPS
jgi:hypothetical protein